MADKTAKVRVLGKSRVVYPDDDTAHVKGDELTVPEPVAQQWCAPGLSSKLPRTSDAMNTEALRRIHDAAVQLGAHCDSDCYFNPSHTSRTRSIVLAHSCC